MEKTLKEVYEELKNKINTPYRDRRIKATEEAIENNPAVISFLFSAWGRPLEDYPNFYELLENKEEVMEDFRVFLKRNHASKLAERIPVNNEYSIFNRMAREGRGEDILSFICEDNNNGWREFVAINFKTFLDSLIESYISGKGKITRLIEAIRENPQVLNLFKDQSGEEGSPLFQRVLFDFDEIKNKQGNEQINKLMLAMNARGFNWEREMVVFQKRNNSCEGENLSRYNLGEEVDKYKVLINKTYVMGD